MQQEKVVEILMACRAMCGVCQGLDLDPRETVVAARALLFMCEEAVKMPIPRAEEVQPMVTRLIEDGLR